MVSAVHTPEDVDKTIAAAEDCLNKLPKRYYRSRASR